MKAIKIFLAVSTVCLACVANATTSYHVTYSFESPATAINGAISYSIPTSGGGSGTAVLDDSGLLTMTLHGEQVSDYSSYYGWSPAYSDVIADTTVHLTTTSSGGGVYNLVQAGSFTQYTSCINGALDALNSCSFIPADTSFSADGLAGFYSAQSFTLGGGTIKVITNGFGATLTTDYTLTSVPLPASVWMFGSSILGLAGLSCRRKSAY